MDRELGRKAREDALRQAEVINQGYQIRTQLGKEGKVQIEERKVTKNYCLYY